MAEIIRLTDRLDLSRTRAAARIAIDGGKTQSKAEILLFTGIRYERLDTVPSQATPSTRHPARRKDKTRVPALPRPLDQAAGPDSLLV